MKKNYVKRFICGLLFTALILGSVGCSKSSDTSEGKSVSNRKSSSKTQSMFATNDVLCEEYPAVCDVDGLDYYSDYYCDNSPAFNTEEYTTISENSFSKTAVTPLSTFGADVDTASYSNFRRFVNSGYTMNDFPAGSLRTEEMVNYFKYNYTKPQNGEPFGVTAVIGDCPWNSSAKLLSLGITTNEMDAFDIPSSNIVFLIDVSGSMNDSNKLPLIQKSMALLLDKFDEDDRISIVTYASGTSVVLDGEPGDNNIQILNAFYSLSAGGGTSGSAGIDLAYQIAEKNFIKGGVNRVILCSDGDFNIGRSSQSALEAQIKEKKESGIFLSVLGFGMYNYSDTRMETLADCGNGNYGYIDNLNEAKKILVDEMTSTFVTVAKDVKFQVEFNPATVSEYRLVGYENRALAAEDFTDDTKDGGELGAGHQVTILYELILADGSEEGSDLKYQTTDVTEKGAAGDEYCTLSIAYKAPDGDTSSYLEYPIDVNNYTATPSDDFRFAACVAEASLALRNSTYLKSVGQQEALKNIINTVSGMQGLDSFQTEFLELIRALDCV